MIEIERICQGRFEPGKAGVEDCAICELGVRSRWHEDQKL